MRNRGRTSIVLPVDFSIHPHNSIRTVDTPRVYTSLLYPEKVSCTDRSAADLPTTTHQPTHHPSHQNTELTTTNSPTTTNVAPVATAITPHLYPSHHFNGFSRSPVGSQLMRNGSSCVPLPGYGWARRRAKGSCSVVMVGGGVCGPMRGGGGGCVVMSGTVVL